MSRRILDDLGFAFVHVDLVERARSRVGVSAYERGTSYGHAPGVVDCSSFIKWLWSLRGVWVPRLSIQQSVSGEEIAPSQMRAGDTLFTTGCVNFFLDDPTQGIGHVGLYTGQDTVVHAAGKKWGVKEHSLRSFMRGQEPRVIRRFAKAETVTVEAPSSQTVEWSDDLKWVVLRHASKLGHL